MAESLTSTAGTGASLTTNGECLAVAGLVECLLKFLKGVLQTITDGTSSNGMSLSEAARTDSSDGILSGKVSLVDRLLSLISQADDIKDISVASALIFSRMLVGFKRYYKRHYFTIVDARSEWALLGQSGVYVIIQRLVSLESFKKHAFASYCWESLQNLIPETLEYGRYAEDFFGVANNVLRSLEDSYRQNLQLTTYVQDWSALLLRHHHDEFVGRDSLDWVIFGISDLLQWCIQYIKSTKKPIKISGNLVQLLLRAHLFPLISESTGEEPIASAMPVLHSKTRANLYGIVFALCNDVGEYHRLLRTVRSLLRQGEGPQAWTWGIAQTAEDYSYDTNWNFERSNTIRSPMGYPGLRNLTNTCYMNSLLTQLFMNVRFRGFMLGADIVDCKHTQRLLAETRTLFGYMQGTALKQVDTQGIADTLINYENTLIDVSVQMDVDEFYNLLFDRWESQILSDEGKKTFRSFYGGQLVQQIKSKECPHISEREEPFSAIQCDIQGKANLAESLSAYVGGEMMEGENKYSCTSCGNYVDAVKRHKINERFEFPERIDMAPYSIEYLQDTEQPLSPDLFELVGILVHAGTAESGHYYSFIKERPTKPEQGASWVEFNDAEVTPFNPAQIPDFCFGGVTEPPGYAASSYSKTWNAYMLFYQRVRADDIGLHQEQPLALGVPVQKTLSRDLSKRITIDNETFLRKVCLYDSTHAHFAISLLDRLRSITNSCCSENHGVERDAVLFALEYADQVLSRMKESTDFERLLDSLTAVLRGCSVCCKLALEWIVDNTDIFRNLLLRCPTARVRKSFTDMLIRVLLYLRENDPQEYGFDVDGLELKSGNGVLPETSCGILQRLVYNMRELWSVLHVHSRAWDDYFGLLAAVASFGVPETFILLREDFLKLCLEILIIEAPGAKRLRVESPHYTQFIRLLEKGRRYSLTNLTELLQNLLLKVDLEARSFDPNYHDRPQLDGGKFALSNTEDMYLYYGTESGRFRPLVFLDKIITANSNAMAVKKILQAMIPAEPRAGHLTDILKTILNGVNIDPADQAEPHLRAALIFCETTPSAPTVKEMIVQIAREVDTIGTSGGAAAGRTMPPSTTIQQNGAEDGVVVGAAFVDVL
ncbi:MAG: hypothetical protein L6R40_002206 [Gallowayella cf. fulva]|nr:MAG: hypothetical protein L6R40_002206 [Xanthomendoza cf. fulva]